MRAWLGLGSNQCNSIAELDKALVLLGATNGIEVLRSSSYYRTPPWGDTAQDDFVNAAAEVETGLAPLDLLAAIRSIEDAMGRQRDARRWGPRIIDIDLLLYGDGPYHAAELEVPHPRMHERAFVLVPLAELDAQLFVPGRGEVGDLLAGLEVSGIVKLDNENRK